MSIHKYYKISDDGKVVRTNTFCPRCGPGIFMAQHYDRESCGTCGYTNFKKRTPKKSKEEPKYAKTKTATPEKKPTPAKGKKRKR